jgi:hypothetical protein
LVFLSEAVKVREEVVLFAMSVAIWGLIIVELALELASLELVPVDLDNVYIVPIYNDCSIQVCLARSLAL